MRNSNKAPTVIVTVHRPELTPEERARRMEEIKQAAKELIMAQMKAQGVKLKLGGTQYGMTCSKERSTIPAALCEHIVHICEE